MAHALSEGAAVRRLTPVECERLQGLPDNWTNPDGTAPDSRRYAALGDAVTANVGEWLGQRILEHERWNADGPEPDGYRIADGGRIATTTR